MCVLVYASSTNCWTVRDTYVLNGFCNDPEHDPALQEMLDALALTRGPDEAISIKRH